MYEGILTFLTSELRISKGLASR